MILSFVNGKKNILRGSDNIFKKIEDITKKYEKNTLKQIILVKGNRLYFFNKKNDKWNIEIETDCYIGRNGFSSNRHSGDLTTPLGFYKILYAFGTDEQINSNIKYKKITYNSYFSDDEENLKQYNTWVESNKPINGEHLIDYPKEYHYGMVIGFNINPKIKGKGSSIFLHCKGNKTYTSGCIAIDEKIIVKILEKIDKMVYIIIMSN